ncbi:hypothetical protein AB4144_15505, partial [Rhizobiaceae sp. 2RAB30]
LERVKLDADWAALRAFPLFSESRKRSSRLFSRDSRRKTAAHFCWNSSRRKLVPVRAATLSEQEVWYLASKWFVDAERCDQQ